LTLYEIHQSNPFAKGKLLGPNAYEFEKRGNPGRYNAPRAFSMANQLVSSYECGFFYYYHVMSFCEKNYSGILHVKTVFEKKLVLRNTCSSMFITFVNFHVN